MNLWQKVRNIVRWYHEHDGATMDAAVNAIMEAFSIERDEYKRKAQLLREALRQCRELFSDIRSDWSDPRMECREGRRIIDAVLRETEDLEHNPGKLQRELDDTMAQNDRYLRSCEDREESGCGPVEGET